MKKQETGGEAEGFTLVELMVVVLIIGILGAIAIPSFLALTSSAKTNAVESDLSAAAQDEAIYFSRNGSYDAATASPYLALDNVAAMNAIDTGHNWNATGVGTAGTKQVYIYFPTNTVNTTVMLGMAGQDGNNYWIQLSNGVQHYATTSGSVTAPAGAATAGTGDFTATSWKADTSVATS